MLSQLSSSDTNISVNIINRERGLYAIKLDKKSLVTNDWNGLTYRLRSSLYTLDRFDKYVTLNKHQGCVNCLNFNKAGNILVTGSDDLKIILWDWARQRPLHVKQTGHRSNVFQAKFVDSMGANNMNDFRLATSARDGEVRYILPLHHAADLPIGSYIVTKKLYTNLQFSIRIRMIYTVPVKMVKLFTSIFAYRIIVQRPLPSMRA